MKKHFAILFLSLWAVVGVMGQTLSDEQVLQMAVREKQSGATEADIVTRLIQKGATMEQLQRIRSQYAPQISKRGLDNTVDNAISDTQTRMRTNNEPKDNEIVAQGGEETPQYVSEELSPSGKRVFGRDIFNNKNLSFEPVMNIATPQNYVVGPGDVLIIDVYGATQETEELKVSPDGDVVVPVVGPIHVAGLTVAAAQSRIRKQMGRFYSESDIKVTMGQTRTIMVNVMGEVKVPGTYTLSAFSTVFHALYMAGGISELGTLRNIKVFRGGRQISVIDIYEFILNGRLAGNVRLQDNDVIQVGTYDCIVDIAGSVKRPMAYEMRSTESLSTLLSYCGGFTGDAYKRLLRVLRKSEDLKSVYNVNEFEFGDFKMTDGDSVIVDAVFNRYKDMVEIKGAVFRPGMYHLGGKVSSVRSLIEMAAGLREEAMASHGVMRRMKPDRTQEVVSVDIEGILNGTVADVPLKNEDVLLIPTIAEHNNLRTLEVNGEVIFPGTYAYADNMTVEDLILQAGGLTDNASTVKVDVARRKFDSQASTPDKEMVNTFSFTIAPGFEISNDRSFTLMPYDVVSVRRSPMAVEPYKVHVEGEVAFEGIYTLEKKDQRLSDVVKAAGGVIDGAYTRGAQLIRIMTEAEQRLLQDNINMARQRAAIDQRDSLNLEIISEETTYSVGIHLDEALASPGGEEDIELRDGDRLIIPRMNRTVRISGDVLRPNTVSYKHGKNYKYYVEQAGGNGRRARKSQTYIIYQNGTIAKASKGKIEPGCEVVVPTKGSRNQNSVSQWLTGGMTLASIGAVIASILK